MFRNSTRQAKNCSLSLSTGAFKSGAKRSLAGDMTNPALCSKCGSVTRSMPIWMGESSSPSIRVRHSGSCWLSLRRSVISKSDSGTQSLSIRAM